MRRAAAALLAIGVSAACRRAPEETRFLNFDPESTRQGTLVSGWSGFEKSPAGDTFTWCQARVAKVAIQSRGDGDRLIRFRCWPFRYEGAPPQTVTLYVSGAKVETFTLDDGPRVYTALAPAAAFEKGANELRLEFGYAEAPRDRMPGSADARTLSAAFDWLEIVPSSGMASRN